MSPEERTTIELRRLLRDIEADKHALETRAQEVELALEVSSAEGWEWKNALAASIHHFYTAFERILERAFRHFEGQVPEGPRYHTVLLREASKELKDIRPALLRPEALSDWDELRRFRHFFRNAYAATLDADRLRVIADTVVQLHPLAMEDIDRLETFVRETIHTIELKG